jgi:hypothetical protein
MASTKTEKSDLVSANGLTDTSSPGIKLLIDILVNEVRFRSVAVGLRLLRVLDQ